MQKGPAFQPASCVVTMVPAFTQHKNQESLQMERMNGYPETESPRDTCLQGTHGRLRERYLLKRGV